MNMKISRDLLMYFLYGRNEEEATKGPLPVLESLPSDITIGHSMIPGAKYGVFPRQHILRGLVVGPLNLPLGQSKEHLKTKSVPEEELVIHQSWSWLKYIQPARHPYEENARIDQTSEGIFLGITHDISPGCEILAWYSDSSLSKFGVDCMLSYSTATSVSTSSYNGNTSPGSSTSPRGPVADPPVEHSVATPQPPTSPLKPLLTTLPHKPLIPSPPQLPHKPLVSPPQIPAKAVCRLCGEMYSSYVELWAHVTTAHASTTPLPRTTPQLPTTTPTSILPNSPLPYPLPILPLNLGLPLTKPYALLSPRMTELLDKTSPDPFLPEGDVIMRDCKDTERPYECGHCGKSFSLPSSLRRHIITHTGERPYKCGYCGRAFAGATTLNNHIRIHTGEKPHICHDCGAGFTQATQLNRHIRCCPSSKNGSATPTNSIQHHTEIFVS